MQFNAIILAAGKGERMGSKAIPKVMEKLAGKPVIDYVINQLAELGVNKPVVVVGFQGQKIVDYLGDYFQYAWQKKRLGTAHAALQARNLLKDKKGYTFILYGDNPLLSGETLQRVANDVKARKAAAAVTVAQAPESLGLGVVVTGADMRIKEIIEQKVAPPEVVEGTPWRNTGSWLVENSFLWQALPKIKKNPKTGEYYLTDLAYLANLDHKLAIAVPVADPTEAIGINTPEQLKQAEKWLHTKAGG